MEGRFLISADRDVGIGTVSPKNPFLQALEPG
jgi:hypothetical protein